MSALVMYTVYDHPTDFPHSFVVRRWTVTGERNIPDPLPFVIGPTLEAVRAALPEGLHNLGRATRDEPQIVETWA